MLDALSHDLDLVAMRLGVPYVHVNGALHADYTGTTPLYFYDWPYEAGPEACARNRAGVEGAAGLLAPLQPVIQEYVEQTGLPLDLSDPYAAFSKLARLTQTPREFDFPGDHWPPHFHHTGPFHRADFRPPISFPWDRLSGEPLIYISMGTLLNAAREIFETIIEAANASGRQLVLSIGAQFTPEQLVSVPANAIVVNHAP